MTRDARLAAYLARIGLDTGPAPGTEGLAQLQAAHRQQIGFENLDIALGRGIAIDSDAVFDKLVTRRRGGYCFEMNRLLADMLAALGLPNRPLLARTRLGLPDDVHVPRTHVLLLLELGGEPWIADAGFGGSYVPPMPLRDGVEVETPDGARHRLVRTGERGSLSGEFLLERAGSRDTSDGRAIDHGDWQGQYCFDLAEVHALDLEQANHWTATHTKSRFVGTHIASVVLEDGFASLNERVLKVHAGGQTREREITSPQDYAEQLSTRFKIDLLVDEAASLPLFAGP
jgi:N-hydroxyarylamine O-acetyltransferase